MQSIKGIHQDDLWVKCNVNCTLFNNNSIIGLDICFTDYSKALLNFLQKCSIYNSTPSEAEALDLLEAINFVANQGMTFVIFQSGCKLVVETINSNSILQNEFEDIITRYKVLLPFQSNYTKLCHKAKIKQLVTQSELLYHTLTPIFFIKSLFIYIIYIRLLLMR